MNKLYELIQQLCPDGVKYKKFGNVCQYIRGITYSKPQEVKDNSTNAWKVMRANNITLGSNVINFEDVKLVKREVYVRDNQLLKKGDILICAGSGSKEHIGKVAYIFDDMEYTFGGFMAVIRCGNELNSRFLFHILTGNSFSVYLSQALNSTTINNLNAGIMKNYLIPVPPLEVQQEIVRILDHFTELTAELTTELTTELTARKEQYKYYSLSLINHAVDIEEVPIRSLGTWRGGCTPSMENSAFWSDGNIPWVSSKDMKAPLLVDTQDHITQEALSKTSIKLLPKNTVAIVARSGILKHTLPVVFIPFETTVNQDIKALTAAQNIEPRYAYHVLNANSGNILQRTKKQGGTVDSLDIQKFMNYLVPVPPLPEQRRIVAILDRFDALCNDLTSGLPAEIAARQKQYEYYRDKLLSFKEL